MPSIFPTDPKKIRERIRRYERMLEREFRSGAMRDGYGKRFLLGPLYMLAGDLDGALASFEWFEETFPDSYGEPYQYLCWALALYRGRRWEAATVKLYETMLKNVYLIPHLVGDKPKRDSVFDDFTDEGLQYALDTPDELLAMWNEEERAWARQTSKLPGIKKRVARFIAIHRELNREAPGRRRTALCNEAHRLKRSGLEDLA